VGFDFSETKTGPLTAALHKTELTTHRERNGNRRIDLDRIAVELRRLVTPLFHGVESRLDQERVPGNHFELRDSPVLVDDRVKNNVALNAGLARQRR